MLKRLTRSLLGGSSVQSPSPGLATLPAAPAPPPFLAGRGRGAQLAAYQGWVFAAVNAISRRVAGIPLRLLAETPEGPGPELGDHPLLRLLARPNPILSGRQLRFLASCHLELCGMAFFLINNDRLGRPAELWPLSPADLIEIRTSGHTAQPITGFVFQGPGGKRVSYSFEQILYFRHPSPRSLVYGASPIEAMAHAFDIDLAVRVYQRNFFANSARPEVVLATEQRLTEDEARRILTGWRQKHQGLRHAFEPTILDGGLSVQPLSYSAKDFEFMELAGWTRDNILAAYGVPAGKLGLVKDVNRANAQGIDITFNAECIRPRLELLEDVFSVFLLPRYGQGLRLVHDNPVPTDREQAHKEAMERLDRGALTINEYRAGLGKGPVPWGDQPYQASSQQADKTDKPGDVSTGGGFNPAAARKAYQALEARFAGWSRPKVKQELEDNPGLLQPLLPPEVTGELRGLALARFQDCLERGLSFNQASAPGPRSA